MNYLSALVCFMGLLPGVTGQVLQPGFLSSYNSALNRYSPIYGYQLPDSSYRILCQERENGWTSFSATLAHLDKYGRFLGSKAQSIPGIFGHNINKEDVCSDHSGNLYYRVGASDPQNPAYPAAFVKVRPGGDTLTYQLQKAGVVQTTFLSPMQDGRLVSYYSNPSDSANGKAFEIINPNIQAFPVEKISGYMQLTHFYQVLEYDTARFIFTDFRNDSMVLYKTDTGGNIIASRSFVVYAPGSAVHTPGTMQLLKRGGNLFFLYSRYLSPIDGYQPYLCKMDMNMQVQWEKPVGDTLKAGSRILAAPISQGRFLLAYTRNIYSPNPYLGLAGIYFSYLDANGDSYNNLNVSTRPYGWVINDSTWSVAWFELVSMTQTLDKGIMITCNVGVDDLSYKGAFTILKTDSNGTLYMDFPPLFTGTGNVPGTYNWNAYPNPFTHSLTIEGSETEAGALIITGMDGQQVYNGYVRGRTAIATDSWTKGIYFYSLQTGSQVTKGKLVKF